MKNFYYKLITTTALFFFVNTGFAQIKGLTWQDQNANNIRESSEIPQSQINVRAYNALGNLIDSVHTDKNGNYNLNVRTGQQVRIEFDSIPKGFVISSGKAATYFVTSPSEISLGIYHPAFYTGENAFAVQASYAVGSLEIKGIDSIPSIVTYSAFPKANMSYTGISTVKKTGSIWGLAFDRQRRLLLSSSIAKRHSAFGPQGPGGIYVTSIINGETKPLVNLDKLGYKTFLSIPDRNLRNDWTVADHDSLMFSLIGKISLGGLDISDDSRFLYVMNLYDRNLYRIRLNESGSITNSDISRFPLPLDDYTGGKARPFAVKYYNGKVYIGVVNDAQVSQKTEDLQAYIYAIDADANDPPNASFTEITRFPLNYVHGKLDYNVRGWFPWTDNYLQTVLLNQSGWMIYPQPILADIEFEIDGSIIVSIMDRLGHQTIDGGLYKPNAKGSFLTARGLSGGDVLRLNKTNSGFQLEQNGQSGNHVSLGKGNGQGPGGGEFYFQDNFVLHEIEWHQETITGGLAMLAENNSVLVSIREPDQYVTGGVKWFSNETGETLKSLSISPGNMKYGYFWKQNNSGDIELMTTLPSIEIGDRIWLDNNNNGIQDSDEPALPGIILQLYRANQLIGNTVSDKDGKYLFSNKNVNELIKSRTKYEIRIMLDQAGGKLVPTTSLTGNSSEIDSDAITGTSEYVSMTVTTKNPGENILNIDAGFQCVDKKIVSVQITCENNLVKINLLGYQENQRYDFTPSLTYEGAAKYETANQIRNSGLIYQKTLTDEQPFLAAIRVYSASGCSQDIFVNTATHSGCAYIPENLLHSDPFSLIIYPNPTLGPLKIGYKGGASNSKIRIEVIDIRGIRIVSKDAILKEGFYLNMIDLSHFTTGAYVVRITEGNNMITKTIAKF